jgi:hypothetical protein
MVDVQRRHGHINKPICISEYNIFMKGVNRRDMRYIYKFCLVPLRKEECFERYHTLKHF